MRPRLFFKLNKKSIFCKLNAICILKFDPIWKRQHWVDKDLSYQNTTHGYYHRRGGGSLIILLLLPFSYIRKRNRGVDALTRGGRQKNSTQGFWKSQPGFGSTQGFRKFHQGFLKVQPRVLENYKICTSRGTTLSWINKFHKKNS